MPFSMQMAGVTGSNPVGATSRISIERLKASSTVAINRIPSIASHGHELPGFASAMATGWQRFEPEPPTRENTVDNIVGGVFLSARPSANRDGDRSKAMPYSGEAMRVVVFGAGASKAAGYPLASELMTAIGGYAESQPRKIPGANLEWREWCQIRDDHLAPLSFLLKNPNPEVILSALDLFAAGVMAFPVVGLPKDGALPKGIKLDRFSKSSDENRKARAIASPALRARAFIVQSLHELLRHLHRRDAAPEVADSHRYLRDLLADLSAGDVVITFNWDALAERILGKRGLWTPLDGYSLDKRHLRFRKKRLAGPRASAVKVLKLHGSIGWYWNPDRWCGDRLFLDCYTFLRDLGFPSDSEPFGQDPDNLLEDPEVWLNRYLSRPVMTYPTFLKTVATVEFSRLWYEADRALEDASRVEIYGYSLPPSDGAARALFNKLRFRMASKKVSVMVRDPSKSTRDTWRAFLGPRVALQTKALC